MFSATWIRVDARVLTKGTMHVTLQRGEGLKGVEKGGTKVRSVIMARRFIVMARRLISDNSPQSDPFVKLSLCGANHKSKVVNNDLNPRWDQTFSFDGELRALTSEPLALEVSGSLSYLLTSR